MNEIIYTKSSSVKCHGSSFPEDHPVIYLQISEEDKNIKCPYCNRIFQLDDKK